MASKREPAEIVLRAAVPETPLDIDLSPRLVLFGSTKPLKLDTHLARLKGIRIVRADNPEDISLA
jgi:hypothetical protein